MGSYRYGEYGWPTRAQRNRGFDNYFRRRERGMSARRFAEDTLYRSVYHSLDFHDEWNCPVDETTGRQKRSAVYCMEFSPDGTAVGAGFQDSSVGLYDPRTCKKIIRNTAAHEQSVNCLKFLDDHTLATGSDDKSIKLWDRRNMEEPVRQLRGHTSWVKNLSYSRQQNTLVSSGLDGLLFSWDLNCLTEHGCVSRQMMVLPGLVRSAMSPDETRLVLTTSTGYLMVVNDLDIATFPEDFVEFNPNVYRLMQKEEEFIPAAAKHQSKFGRDRNNVALISDFPLGDDAAVISGLTIHPQGWCALSRNSSFDRKHEYTTVHNIENCKRPYDECDDMFDEMRQPELDWIDSLEDVLLTIINPDDYYNRTQAVAELGSLDFEDLVLGPMGMLTRGMNTDMRMPYVRSPDGPADRREGSPEYVPEPGEPVTTGNRSDASRMHRASNTVYSAVAVQVNQNQGSSGSGGRRDGGDDNSRRSSCSRRSSNSSMDLCDCGCSCCCHRLYSGPDDRCRSRPCGCIETIIDCANRHEAYCVFMNREANRSNYPAKRWSECCRKKTHGCKCPRSSRRKYVYGFVRGGASGTVYRRGPTIRRIKKLKQVIRKIKLDKRCPYARHAAMREAIIDKLFPLVCPVVAEENKRRRAKEHAAWERARSNENGRRDSPDRRDDEPRPGPSRLGYGGGGGHDGAGGSSSRNRTGRDPSPGPSRRVAGSGGSSNYLGAAWPGGLTHWPGFPNYRIDTNEPEPMPGPSRLAFGGLAAMPMRVSAVTERESWEASTSREGGMGNIGMLMSRHHYLRLPIRSRRRPDLWGMHVGMREYYAAIDRRPRATMHGAYSGVGSYPDPDPGPHSGTRDLFRNIPRLMYYKEEACWQPLIIRESCFTPDGRVIFSPHEHGIRLLTFDEHCSQLYRSEGVVLPSIPQRLQVLSSLDRRDGLMVLCCAFSPREMVLVTGNYGGDISFYTPQL